MTKRRAMATLFTILATATYAAQELSVSSFAKTYYPAATWKEGSVLRGDFSCHGKSEWAILGTSPKFIVVAIFNNGLGAKPTILEYSTEVRSAESAVLTKESRDYKPGETDGDGGGPPDSFTPSKTCVGLNLSDGEIDSAHIYWDMKYKQFVDWTL